MFQVTQSQFDSLANGPFIERIAALLADRMPPKMKEMPREFLMRMAQDTVVVARSYGLTAEDDIGGFALNMLTINPHFHLQPHIHAILIRQDIAAPDRMERILSDASDQDWNEAQAMTSATEYWQVVFARPDDSPNHENGGQVV
jgi:hypothetical protein